MPKYKMTYAIYWEVEVDAEDEEDAYFLGKDKIPDMTVGCDEFILVEANIMEVS
jgi:hypothetical protein